MKKNKISVIDNLCVFALLVVGSMITYFAMNLFWSDVANKANAFNFPYVFATFPLLMISIGVVTFAMFFVRYLIYDEQYRKYLVMHYLKLFIAYAAVGIITSIISAAFVYKSCLTPCPFPGSLIVFFAIHLIFLVGSIVLSIKIKKAMTEKDVRFKTKVKYRLYTVVMALFTFIAFDRCGAAVVSPTYIEWSRLDITWTFYFSLLLPMVLLVTIIVYKLNHLDAKNYKNKSILWGIYFLVCLALCIIVVISGTNDSTVVSLISPAMPIERLATIPIDFIVLYIPIIAISAVNFIRSLVNLVKSKKNPVVEENKE